MGDYDKLWQLAAIVVVAGMVDSMERAFVGPKLEERLGRPLTNRDWQVYRQEKANRERYQAISSLAARLQQELADRQIIHDFVWEGDASW